MIKELPVIYSGESKSTTIRLYFEEVKYRDDALYKKYITINNKPLNKTNKEENYTYEMVNNQFLLRHEHLITGELNITIELVSVPDFGMPEFKAKWVFSNIPVYSSSDKVQTTDWEKEYNELIEEGYQSTLQSIKDNINEIENALQSLDNNKVNVTSVYTKSELDGKLGVFYDELEASNRRIDTLESKSTIFRIWA